MTSIAETLIAVARVEIEDKAGEYPFDFAIDMGISRYYELAIQRHDQIYLNPYEAILEKGPEDRINHNHHAIWRIEYPGNPGRVVRATKTLHALEEEKLHRGLEDNKLTTNKLLTIHHYGQLGDLSRGWQTNIEWAAGFIHLLSLYPLLQEVIDKVDANNNLITQDFMWRNYASRYDQLYYALAQTRHSNI